ncbi:hypothetical protein FRC02_000992 [Tulasnella sp. 418]|nr:hypothetical protein FRC02_000992 [Tulasnella sp. 418]
MNPSDFLPNAGNPGPSKPAEIRSFSIYVRPQSPAMPHEGSSSILTLKNLSDPPPSSAGVSLALNVGNHNNDYVHQAASSRHSDMIPTYDNSIIHGKSSLYHERPAQKRKSRSEIRRPGHIARPPNAFILFRSHVIANNAIPYRSEKSHGNVSKAIGTLWNDLSAEEKAYWQQRAEMEKEAHRLMYPDYKFTPRKRGRNHSHQQGAPATPIQPPNNEFGSWLPPWLTDPASKTRSNRKSRAPAPEPPSHSTGPDQFFHPYHQQQGRTSNGVTVDPGHHASMPTTSNPLMAEGGSNVLLGSDSLFAIPGYKHAAPSSVGPTTGSPTGTPRTEFPRATRDSRSLSRAANTNAPTFPITTFISHATNVTERPSSYKPLSRRSSSCPLPVDAAINATPLGVTSAVTGDRTNPGPQLPCIKLPTLLAPVPVRPYPQQGAIQEQAPSSAIHPDTSLSLGIVGPHRTPKSKSRTKATPIPDPAIRWQAPATVDGLDFLAASSTTEWGTLLEQPPSNPGVSSGSDTSISPGMTAHSAHSSPVNSKEVAGQVTGQLVFPSQSPKVQDFSSVMTAPTSGGARLSENETFLSYTWDNYPRSLFGSPNVARDGCSVINVFQESAESQLVNHLNGSPTSCALQDGLGSIGFDLSFPATALNLPGSDDFSKTFVDPAEILKSLDYF